MTTETDPRKKDRFYGGTPRQSSKVLSQEPIKLTRQQAIKARDSTRLRSGNCQRFKATRKLVKRRSRSGIETQSMIGRVNDYSDWSTGI